MCIEQFTHQTLFSEQFLKNRNSSVNELFQYISLIKVSGPVIETSCFLMYEKIINAEMWA